MIIDISLFGFIRFYFSLACPWCATAIGSQNGTGWEYCSLHLSIPAMGGKWYIGWAWDTDLIILMFGPWEREWEKN